jgi:hypothetical protein
MAANHFYKLMPFTRVSLAGLGKLHKVKPIISDERFSSSYVAITGKENQKS